MERSDVRKGKTITLSISESCNLNCTYCYEHHKTNRTMSLETAKRIVYNELTKDDGIDDVLIEYFGGEPFLAFDTISKLHEYIIGNVWPKHYTIFIPTNGTLVHGVIMDWLNKNKNTLVCGVSLDGNPYMHNINRTNSFDEIDHEFFRTNWPNQSIKIISPETICFLSSGVIFLQELGFDVECNLACGISWDKPGLTEVLERELNVLVDYYIDHPKKKPCSMLSMGIEYISEESKTVMKWCGAGTLMKAYDTNGIVYPCQYFMPISIGMKKSMLVNQIEFTQEISIALLDSKCQNCLFVYACPTCYGSNYLQTGNIHIKDDFYCVLIKIMFAATSYLKAQKLMLKQLALSEDEEYRLISGINITQQFISRQSG